MIKRHKKQHEKRATSVMAAVNVMRNNMQATFTSTLTLLAAAIFTPLASAEPSEHAAAVAQSFDRFNEADDKFDFLNENCMECHNADDWAGSLAFDLIAPNEIADNVAVWEKVINKLQGRM